MEQELLYQRIEELGITDLGNLEKMVELFAQFSKVEQENREIANCDGSRLNEMRLQFLNLVEKDLTPLLAELKNISVSLRVVVEQLENKVNKRLIFPLKKRKENADEMRIPFEDALGSLIYEMRFLILNMVVNHPSCKLHDPHRVYVTLYPEVERDIQNTGILYNLLNQLYKDLTQFLSFQSLPESFIPRSLKVNTSLLTKNITIWDYIKEIFQSGKLIRPETWIAVGKELQNLINAGEKAINECGNVMRLSDKTDFQDRLHHFHQYSYDLAHCHIKCLDYFKKQKFDLITPAEMRQMVELTIQLDETVSELQHFLRVWMRHLDARTCLHYTVVLQTLENEGRDSQ